MSDSSSSSSSQDPAQLASASVAPQQQQQQRQPHLMPQLQSNQSQLSDSSLDSLEANPTANEPASDAPEASKSSDSSEQAINEFKNIGIIVNEIDSCARSTRSLNNIGDCLGKVEKLVQLINQTKHSILRLASECKIKVIFNDDAEGKIRVELIRESQSGPKIDDAIVSPDDPSLAELLLQTALEAFVVSIKLDSASTQKDKEGEISNRSSSRASCSKDAQQDFSRETQDNVKIGAKKLKISSTSAVVRTPSTESVNNSVNDSSSQDDDSEPILGLLFREHPDSDKRSPDPSGKAKDGKILLDPAIQSSQKLMCLATQLLDFINGCFVSQQDLTLSSNVRGKLCAKQLEYLNQFILSLDESWKPVGEFFSLSRSFSSTANNLLSIRFFESDDEAGQFSEYSSLTNLAETILDLTLRQTATFTSDNIKLNFTDIFNLMTSHTGLNGCANHKMILPNAIRWLEACWKHLKVNQVFASMLVIDKSDAQVRRILDATCCLIAYLGGILGILRFIVTLSAVESSEPEANDQHVGSRTDWVDEGPCFNLGEDEDDDESTADDSDDDTSSNKLCTFTLTQKEFVNQHWYHCHTCIMIDRVGVCTVCAKVCHKDHDISYSKFGAFFCDCAGREGSTCAALVRRAPSTSDEIRSYNRLGKNEHPGKQLGNMRDKSREKSTESKKAFTYHQKVAKHLEPYKDDLIALLSSTDICKTIMELLYGLIPTYVQFAQDECYMGRCKRARAALEKFHTSQKSFCMTESLMLPTLGSQEGAFENVRVNFTGEHASLIKQLIMNNSLRRVAMTSLSSPLGKRQHLVVCHERGKITLLQLNALLRQADSSKRKLTLTRLASAPVPFSVISITANPFNEDVLAVCGLRDCHVLTFTQNGLVACHIELNLDLTSASDHIVKAVWIPGSQVELAILTTEVIKIYDLSEECTAPKHHLKLAFGQIKDVTFIIPEASRTKYILIMNTAGHIFKQELEGRTLSSHGLFYVTAELRHTHINEKEGRINGGGVSLYFSHSFKTLFFSYTDGNYMASMPKFTDIQQVFPLEFELSHHVPQPSGSQISYASIAATGQGSKPDESSKAPPKSTPSSVQPLCQWSEIPGHTGMMMAFCQTSNNPVILMLNPDRIMAQEIKYLSIKSKITDATAIRHTTSSGEVRTTLILLCEDGSLRIYMASQDLSNAFWLRLSPSHIMPLNFGPFSLNPNERKASSKAYKKSINCGSIPSFPVDFFENLQSINDVEFSGNDVLSVYSVQQLKSRLNLSGTYITCSKAAGFSIDVSNNDANMVVCGIRVQVGAHDLTKSPTSIEVFGRTIPINPLTARWYDIPLTRDESLQAEKKFTVSFGPSSDPNNITTIDSVKIYGKTKDSFSWPDDGEENVNSTHMSGEDLIGVLLGRETGSKFQKLIIHSVECLDSLLNLKQTRNIEQSSIRKLAQEFATSLITVPYPTQVSKVIKNLMMTVYSDPGEYNNIRELTALEFVTTSLARFEQEDLDAKLFSRVVYIMKSLCQTKLSMITNLTKGLSNVLIEQDSNLRSRLTTESAKLEFIMLYLHGFFQHLHSQRPINLNLASVCSAGPINYDETLKPFMELVYIAMLHDLTISNVATTILLGYILNEDLEISICARHTLIRLLRVKGHQAAIHDQKAIEREKVRQHHLTLLQKLIERLPETRSADGYRSISLLHVVLVLTLDLDYENEYDNMIFRNLLCALREELLSNTTSAETIAQRSPTNEVKLVIMRMFSILMSKVRTSSIASTVSNSNRAETSSCWSTYCSSMTASVLIDSEVLSFCFNVLKHLTDYWREFADNQKNDTSGSSSLVENIIPINKKTLPKSNTQSQAPDLAPFFIRSHVKSQADLLEDFTQLLTEMVLRIPYQIKKVSSSSSNSLKPVVFPSEWSTILCEYLMIQIPSFIKRHVRKLLTFICGSKENYRQLRDFHFLESHMKSIKTICGITDQDKVTPEHMIDDVRALPLNYEAMSLLVEHLKACIEIAQNRCINWQVYCLLKDQRLLCSLVKISLNFGEDVSPIVLELLQHALSSPQLKSGQNLNIILGATVDISTTPLDLNSRQAFQDTLTSESLNVNLSQQLIGSVSKELLSRFIQSFLLETNYSSLRWQAHGLLFNLWSNFSTSQQHEMLLIFWSLWHNLPKYGRKAAQFVDLIGYITIKSPESDADYDKVFCQETLNVLRQQNLLLMNHPNAHIYSSIQGLVDLESFYLESDPCSVCNSPEVGFNNVKLSSIKVDSRFTTTTHIIKLIGSHTILKFTLRISDIKRSKMVKVVSIYYNNRSVQSVVELKNKPGIWSLARKQSLSPNQTEVKIEFTLPIIACNLMIEFSEFYDNFQASSETLQCPRCSTSVSANPGVCSNCGENVFQCHKCRAINYDEKDPFLCISCGFCKYARFDISLTARPTCAVDPIENEDDRKKTVAAISSLMEKADRIYRNLIQNKPTLELLLLRIHEQVLPDKQYDENYLSPDQGSPQSSMGGTQPQSSGAQSQPVVVSYAPPTGPTSVTPSVNKAIQHLAQKYCIECKSLFEELSKVTRKVLASRKELVEYDNRQLGRFLSASSSVLSSANRRKSRVYSSLSSCSGRCYGCATATVDHCVKMLKALSTLPKLRGQICESGVINELVNFNLRSGSYTLGQEIRELLCTLTRGDLNSTTTLTDLLMEKIEAISKQDYQPFEISNIVKHELSLLSVTLDSDDNCCELRLRCLIKVFAFALEIKNPTVMECLVIPCLRLLLSIIKPPAATTRRHKDKGLESVASIRTDSYRGRVSLQEWLNDCGFVFELWRKKSAKPANQSSKSLKPMSSLGRSSRSQHRINYLSEKYGYRWRLKSAKLENATQPINDLPNDWLKRLLFNRSSKTVRSMAKLLVDSFFEVQPRRGEIVELMTSYLDEVGPSGECAQEFFHLYKQIIATDHWRHYLSLRGILIKLSDLVTVEIDSLQELEETTLNSSLSSGYALKMLLEILTEFVSVPEIHAHYKSKLVGFILKGYLSLRKLVVQRTKVIDEAQEMLLELLEGMTTGSESETAAFINVCVEAIRNCHDGDIRTPVFIFERLCSTIHPEENASSEFFVSLEKDPQQEDYLQGRMLGNPYSSNDAGIGPLMKDIKNKICQDCELLALLEDDSSMELLVSNKIICLDLPVRDVYKRIWCAENHESEAMRIVYRMRGLLGDATEEFIESLDSRNSEEIDEEQVYKMANIMSSSGGLEIMLSRLRHIDDLSPPFKPLLDVILKLFNQCTKTKDNRLKLTSSTDLKTIETLLNTLKLALNETEFLEAAGLPEGMSCSSMPIVTQANRAPANSNPNPRTNVVNQLLSIIGTLLREASQQPTESYTHFCSEACGTVDDIRFLLHAAQTLSSRLPHLSQKIIQVAPFLTLGIAKRMSSLVEYFKSSMDFETFDQDHSALNDSTIDLFCIMVDAIARNDNGNLLKDFIVEEEIVAKSIAYLTTSAPPLKSSLLATSEEWKEFTSRPALKYVLRILGGLSQDHSSTQVLISRDCIPIVHGLEQVSSDAHVGTLAENLLEAIKQHPAVAEKIELVRRQTKEEKKRLAMAVRERQLGALGMKANERGQVIAKSKLLDQCLDLAEDTGLICNICREGYKFQPTKVLGIYTYTKRCVLDEFEMKPRKSYGYTTVTHFNTVHVECHMSAVRSARGRDEWDSAALQNANTRCNGLLPIWGPQVPESSYASALARHNSYLQDSTGYRDIGYHSTNHDIRLQLLRFAQERSFSEDTGGGGPQSNLHLLPYMMQTALYVLNSTKAATREYKRALNFLEMSSSEVIDNCYEVDGPYYWCSLALLVLPPIWWKKKRLQFLQRLIVCNHVRRVSIKSPAPISDTRVRAYSYYKSALIFFAFIDSFYNIVFKDASIDDKWNQDWSATLADYLKHNEQTINDNIEVLLNLYQNSLLTCTTLERYFEIVRIDEISQPSEFIVRTLESV